MRLRLALSVLAGAVLLATASADAGTQEKAAVPFTIEYYYKIKWGYAAEWMDLYKKNHYPILVRRGGDH